jgi:predicted acylesterase/phospholipase RssA/CRP-like cAMP-binding protein
VTSPLRVITAPPDAASFLRDCDVFRVLTEEVRERIRMRLTWHAVPGQSAVITQGQTSDSVHVVYSGTLRVLGVGTDGRPTVWREHHKGDMIGEAGVLTAQPRSATIVAIRDSVVATLDAATFHQLVEAEPTVGAALSTMLSHRLIARTPPLRSYRFVATLALGDLSENRDQWNSLTERVAEGSDAVRLPLDAVRQGLDEYEGVERVHLIDVTGLDSTELERTLRQVDRIVVAFYSDDTLRAYQRQVDLIRSFTSGVDGSDAVVVLVQKHGSRLPTRSLGAISRFGDVEHHHVRANRLADAVAVGRALAGRDLCLVLGGGGARGAAHIGVLKAIDQLGLNVDRVGGTSMGAIMGAAHAAGLDWQSIIDMLGEFQQSGAMREVSVPTVALLATRKLERIYGSLLGDAGIEDLWRPFFCTSVNLTSGRLDVHRTGRVTTWIRASGAVPGVFPPVAGPDGSLHIDGGLLNNLPSDIMRGLTRGRIVMVDVAAPTTSLRIDPVRTPPLGWRDVVARIRKRPTYPSVVNTMQRGALLSSSQQRSHAFASADLVLEPPLIEFGLFDFASTDAIVERGYRTAMETLPPWLASVGLL